jgi:aspartate-semialdehyde dehydrogenase
LAKEPLLERPLVAVVGGDTLLAREICELLGESKPAPRIQLISAAAGAAALLDADPDAEEAVIMLPLAAESLEGARVAFLTGSAASSRRTLKLNPEPVSSHTKVIAHPAAIALTMLFSRLARIAAIRRAVVHVFEPASERAQPGLDELQKQTVAVLAFQKLKTDIFDAQLAFNLLARYGEEAPEPLDSIEQRLERHLASLLSAYPVIPMPSLRLIQAPVFHGHSFSVWVEFEENPGAEALARSLAKAGLDVRPDDPPTNAGIAGQSGLSLGAIAQDQNQPRACWLWMVADNLRLAAENALAVARETL